MCDYIWLPTFGTGKNDTVESLGRNQRTVFSLLPMDEVTISPGVVGVDKIAFDEGVFLMRYVSLCFLHF